MKKANRNLILCLILALTLALPGGIGAYSLLNDNNIVIAESDSTPGATITPEPEDEPEPASILIQEFPATMDVGDTAKLSYVLNNSDDDVSWRSNDTDVITVDSNGNITAVGPGAANVTASAGSASDTARITVREIQAESIKIVSDNFNMADSITGYKIKIDDVVNFSVEVSPKEATVDDVRWEVDKPNLAEIDSNGTLIAHENGTVTVTATADDGNLSDEITIQIGSAIPWVMIAIAAAVAIIIIVLIILLIRQKRRSSRKKKPTRRKYEEEDDDDDEDDDNEDNYNDRTKKKVSQPIDDEEMRKLQEAYKRGYEDRQKDMTRIFDPKDFE